MARVERWEMLPDSCSVYPECPYAGKFSPGLDGTYGDCPCGHPKAARNSWCGPSNMYGGKCPFDIEGEMARYTPAILFPGYPEIMVTRRTDDYHACLKDNPRVWGCGRTHYEAVGNVVVAHQDVFNLSVTHLGG